MLEQAYSPMTIRFFMLQAQYRSTLDFSNEALQAAEKGLNRLLAAQKTLSKIKSSEKSSVDVNRLKVEALEALCDDLNSPIAIAVLFDWVKIINSLAEGKETVTDGDLKALEAIYSTLVYDVLGLEDSKSEGSEHAELTGKLIEMLLEMRVQAKTNKDYATSDKIRDELNKFGVKVMDTKDGFDWEV